MHPDINEEGSYEGFHRSDIEPDAISESEDSNHGYLRGVISDQDDPRRMDLPFTGKVVRLDDNDQGLHCHADGSAGHQAPGGASR